MYLIIIILIVIVLLGILVKINFADSDVSVPARIIVSTLILLVFAASIYYLVTPDSALFPVSKKQEDTLSKADTTTKQTEVITQIQNPVRTEKRPADTIKKAPVIVAPAPINTDTTVITKTQAEKTEVPKSETAADEQEILPLQNITADTSQFDNYKVKLKAFFYNKPDEASRRKDYLFFFNSIPLSALDERNGFIQISIRTTGGKRYEGWLNKNDLINTGE